MWDSDPDWLTETHKTKSTHTRIQQGFVGTGEPYRLPTPHICRSHHAVSDLTDIPGSLKIWISAHPHSRLEVGSQEIRYAQSFE
jgi:hypothetical protein